ncbi:extracellular solute-binding protein [Paenibacillus sp. HJGM_3]|uniref:extracellular solute-binding protein n=1 Tax=Paenibacillus sp. HJGM_3 TaxID=3379816 RepID=UPI00386E7D1C
MNRLPRLTPSRRGLAKNRLLLLLMSVLVLCAAALGADGLASGERSSERASGERIAPQRWSEKYGSLYSQKRLTWKEKGIPSVGMSPIVIPAARSAALSGDARLLSAPIEGKSSVVQLANDQAWVEYDVDVPSDGLYAIALTYIPLKGSFSPIQVGVRLDGDYPYTEARSIQLFRSWKDEPFPPRTNENGDQIRPSQTELSQWTERALTDPNYMEEGPLRWPLTKGRHKLRIESVLDAFALAEIRLYAPEPVPAYEETVKRDQVKKNDAPSGWSMLLEAEQMDRKSDPSVQIQASNDNLAVPASNGKIHYNMMGGFRWNRGGQSADWTFEVPQDGLYYIHLKYMQNFTRDVYTYRQIRLDGRVPFSELAAYAFPYGRQWRVDALSAADGKPFAFYLTRGKHTLTLDAAPSPTMVAREGIRTVMDDFQELNRTIGMMTGIKNRNMVDKNRDWNLAEMMPDLGGQAASLADRLQLQIESLQKLYGNSVQSADGLRAVLQDLRDIAEEPNLLAKRPPEMWAQNIEKMSQFADGLARQPLTLDQIYVTTSPERTVKPPGQWAVLKDWTVNFFRTFSPNYKYYGRRDPEGIDVWVNRGRDYVNVMQQLADESFTATTGIKVNVNLMPNANQLILSNSSGREPDIALGISEGMPADFAMRNSLVDLSRFPDYNDVAKRFHPGTLMPFQYDGGVYALPETVSLNVMFYRNDIMKLLGVKPPETWDDMLRLLPTLKQKGYDFFYNKGNYVPIFLQNGASFYTPDGAQSGLNTAEGFKSFKLWTDLFKVYGFPTEVPSFYMHFRNGDIPIGVSDYNTYMQLLVAAPELTGLWNIAPIPGVRQPDRTIARWSGGSLSSGIIFRSSERQDDAWSFLKWWTSTEVQARFGNEIEMLNGVEFRWNTANVEAFKRLPWPKETAGIILDQWKWYKEVPNVPGGYFTGRELNFAWTKTVLQNKNYREALEQAIFQIDSELKRKQKEFGFVDEDGQQVRKLQVPDLKQPWEGGGAP